MSDKLNADAVMMDKNKLYNNLIELTAHTLDVIDQENEGITPDKIDHVRYVNRYKNIPSFSNATGVNLLHERTQSFVCNVMYLIEGIKNGY